MNKVEIESTACPMCGQAAAKVIYPNFDPYAVVQCQSCNFYYLSPRLTQAAMMESYRKDNYFEGDKGGYDSYLEQETALRATFKRLMQNLRQRGIKGHSLLEIGCGYGYLLDAAKHDFAIRVGTDFSANAVTQAEKSGARVYRGGVENLPDGETFDCVVLTHVIEHVYEPEAFLRSLKEKVAVGGRIVVATPDMGSLWRSALGKRWPSFKMPEHILYFDYRSLAALMQRVGFTHLQSVPYPHAFPLTLIASKLNLRLPKAFESINLWIPGTTLAISGIVSNPASKPIVK
jgi:2-polyprenyl-3-methyl-5-hydroxy-6-metoxy-1,4-benzoquinol methylase